MANNGFFDSVNGDRMYNASDFGRMFEGLISDGVVKNWKNKFEVYSLTSSSVKVKTGRGYFQGTWITLDEETTLPITDTPASGKKKMYGVVVSADFTHRQTTLKLLSSNDLNSTATVAELSSDLVHSFNQDPDYSGEHCYLLATFIYANGSTPGTLINHTGQSMSADYAVLSSYKANWALAVSYDGSIPVIPNPYDYADVQNKPQINGVTLVGNKTAADLSLGSYLYFSDKPQINGVVLEGNKTTEQLGLGSGSSAFIGSAQKSISGSTLNLTYTVSDDFPSTLPMKIVIYFSSTSAAPHSLTLIRATGGSGYYPIFWRPILDENTCPYPGTGAFASYTKAGTGIGISISPMDNLSNFSAVIQTELVW